jgi:hypothetical protein
VRDHCRGVSYEPSVTYTALSLTDWGSPRSIWVVMSCPRPEFKWSISKCESFWPVIKGKDLPVLFNWTPRHEGVLGERKYSSTHSLTSALDEGEWSITRSDSFTPRERAPATYWIGSWVGSQSRSGHGGERKNSQSVLGLEPPIIPLVAQRYTTELPRLLFWSVRQNFTNRRFMKPPCGGRE